ISATGTEMPSDSNSTTPFGSVTAMSSHESGTPPGCRRNRSTEKYDRGVKFGHYRQVPSVQECLVLAQDRVSVERFRRQPGGVPDSWLLIAVTDPNGVVEFESLGISVPVAEIYAGVDFSPVAR
ncbi:MAG: Uma2 family endonuclease, partial [Planctomycetia bacterium]